MEISEPLFTPGGGSAIQQTLSATTTATHDVHDAVRPGRRAAEHVPAVVLAAPGRRRGAGNARLQAPAAPARAHQEGHEERPRREGALVVVVVTAACLYVPVE